MRSSSLSILFVALVTVPCAAQGGRFSFEIMAGRGTDSPVFQHRTADPAGAWSEQTRLAADDASIASGRIGYRLAGGWVLVGEIGQGSGRYYYSRFMTGAGLLVSSEEQWGTASRTAFGLAVTHRTTLTAVPLSIEPELGVGMRRITVGTPGMVCPPQPPTAGGLTPCFSSARWERDYSLPSVGAGLGVGYAIAPRLAVELRGQYSVGRTSTREGFYDDLLPQYDYLEAPTSQTIRSTLVSVGLRIAP